eukprot:TRINITY_DN597_c0_g1_i1.p1 TRINITY_DN597_c0_g1~~TRINITY_DN597_c0_g1_i1.p1  ORF type:complete len:724 (+),score=168.63 TRINITY_DN597_c0_g1_i1:145-2316(+)
MSAVDVEEPHETTSFLTAVMSNAPESAAAAPATASAPDAEVEAEALASPAVAEPMEADAALSTTATAAAPAFRVRLRNPVVVFAVASVSAPEELTEPGYIAEPMQEEPLTAVAVAEACPAPPPLVYSDTEGPAEIASPVQLSAVDAQQQQPAAAAFAVAEPEFLGGIPIGEMGDNVEGTEPATAAADGVVEVTYQKPPKKKARAKKTAAVTRRAAAAKAASVTTTSTTTTLTTTTTTTTTTGVMAAAASGGGGGSGGGAGAGAGPGGGGGGGSSSSKTHKKSRSTSGVGGSSKHKSRAPKTRSKDKPAAVTGAAPAVADLVDVSLLPAESIPKLQHIVHKLMRLQEAIPFNTPVDPVLLNIPDYPTIIKHPMDFGTFMDNIGRGLYLTAPEAVADVRLVFTNALTYNPSGHPINITARRFSAKFEASLRALVSRSRRASAAATPAATSSAAARVHAHKHHHRDDEDVAVEPDAEVGAATAPEAPVVAPAVVGGAEEDAYLPPELPAPAPAPVPPEVAVSNREMESHIRELQKTMNNLQKELHSLQKRQQQRQTKQQREAATAVEDEFAGATSRAEAAVSTRGRKVSSGVMSLEEKKRLSRGIESLASDKLQNVVRIIEERRPGFAAGAAGPEMEIDLEVLDNGTLRALERYVCSVAAQQKAQPARAPSASAGHGGGQDRTRGDVGHRYPAADCRRRAPTRRALLEDGQSTGRAPPAGAGAAAE